MASTDPAVALLQFNLGTAAAFDQRIFPIAYYEEDGNLNKGRYLIKATLEEMAEIHQLGIDLNENDDFIVNTRVRLEESVLVYGPHTSVHVSVVCRSNRKD